MPVDKETVARDLQDWVRKQPGLQGPRDLAEAAGLTPNVVGKYLRGANLPPPEKARALYRVTELPILRQLAGAEQPPLDENGSPSHSSVQDKPPEPPRTPEIDRLTKTGSPTPAPTTLTPDDCKQLLARVDVVRDPIHGDIRLTGLERRLVDTSAFQRLRHLNQLGLTSLVYPGAVHTRFSHSLGVLHVCSEIIAICNANAESYRAIASLGDLVPLRLTPYCELLARLCALLHDVAHVPFGHSLEKEGLLFEHDEWNDPVRSEFLLGRGSEIRRCLRAFFLDLDLPAQAADTLVDEALNILTTGRSAVCTLPFPFVHDIVGNTICADLLDYVRRDMYYCGLTENSGDRFLRYLAVLPIALPKTQAANVDQYLHETKGVLRVAETETVTEVFRTKQSGQELVTCRVVLLQYRYNEHHVPVTKHDVIAEAIDLVRRRLSVAEKAYFHRTKMAATAMLVSAVTDHPLTIHELLEFSDLEVLRTLANSPRPRAKHLGQAIAKRRVYKCIYRISYRPSDDSPSSERTRIAYTKYKNPNERKKLEASIEKLIGLRRSDDASAAAGASSISCPDERMNVKEFDMLVLKDPRSRIKRLQDSSDPPTKAAIQAIQTKHEHLWKLEVYVDPELVDVRSTNSLAVDLAGAIEGEVGLKNEVPELGSSNTKSFDELIIAEELRVFLASEGVDLSNITVGQDKELRALAMRASTVETEEVAWKQAMRDKLGEWGHLG